MEGRSLSWVMPVCFGGSSVAAAARAGWWPCGAWSCEHQGPSSAVENSGLSGVTPRVKGVERSDPTRQEDEIGPCASVSESERLLHGDCLKYAIVNFVNMLHFYLANTIGYWQAMVCMCIHNHARTRADHAMCETGRVAWRSGFTALQIEAPRIICSCFRQCRL